MHPVETHQVGEVQTHVQVARSFGIDKQTDDDREQETACLYTEANENDWRDTFQQFVGPVNGRLCHEESPFCGQRKDLFIVYQ
jgi:hypothetical protein